MLNQLSDGLVKEAVKDSLEEIEWRQKQNEMQLGGIEMLLLTAIRRLKK
jgi:metal-responsive CopG/Arc/MetJ family transcriptional regulator